MNRPAIREDIWGEEPVVAQAYYTVYVYKHNGLGQEASFQNILADSADDAKARVAGSHTWLRLNPMVAYQQKERVF